MEHFDLQKYISQKRGLFGVFRYYDFKSGEWKETPNTLVSEGEQSFLRMMVRDEQTDVAGGGNFYIGLMGNTFTATTTLSTLLGEPTNTGGYARQAVTRNSAGWPTQDTVNGIGHVRSVVINFTASGADFSTTIQRIFLCSVGSGSSGRLFAISAPLAAPLAITNGTTFPVQYDLYLH